jgi:tetratricopeptide (TPR) repeat protein
MSALMLLMVLSGGAQADAQSDYEIGVAALRTGDASAALVSLRAALDQGAVDPNVYHGLGNALYRQGELGPAIAAYRRGLQLAPGNGDIAANLELARKKTRDRLEPPAPRLGPFFWQSSLSTATSARLAGIAAFLGLALLLVRCWRTSGGLLPGAAVALLAAALLAASTAVAHRASPAAVVVVAEVSASSALGPAGVALFSLHEGAEVQVGEHASAAGVDYTMVVLPDGRKGWLPSQALLSTNPSAAFQWL